MSGSDFGSLAEHKTMRRYWIEQKNLHENVVKFEGDIFHHIFDVCRQEKGSKFEVLLNGKAFLVEAVEVFKKSASAKILDERIVAKLPEPHLKLALCMPRFNVLESVIEKAVEMGIHSIQLLSSDYSFIKFSEKISENKWERWQKIIISSTQQSGRGELLTLVQPIPLLKFVEKMDRNQSSLCLFGYEGDSVMTLQDYLRPQALKKWSEAWIIVGGEGGFSTQEAENLKQNGIQPVTLGDQILRVETACIALTSVLKYELGLMRKNI
jgi:16S rRNA (uracil1498-N3)-methyltransferase